MSKTGCKDNHFFRNLKHFFQKTQKMNEKDIIKTSIIKDLGRLVPNK